MVFKSKQLEREYNRQYYIKNRRKIIESVKRYCDEHKEAVSESRKRYRKENSERLSEAKRIYHAKNREKIKEKRLGYFIKYRKENRDIISIRGRRYAQSPLGHRTVNENRKKRLKTDIQFRLSSLLRARLYKVVRGKIKSGSSVRDLGCTIPELKMYLEGQFKDGMTWETWTRAGLHEKAWNIDHKIPLDFFDLSDREQFLRACHYTNLQPMWAVENLKKGNRMPV